MYYMYSSVDVNQPASHCMCDLLEICVEVHSGLSVLMVLLICSGRTVTLKS